jgi:hypothetical protein
MILKKKKLNFSKLTEPGDATNIQSSIINIQLGLAHWILEIDIYLLFGAWDLRFLLCY